MRLIVKEFEKYAKQKGVSPKIMLIRLGGGKYAYKNLKKGCSLGYELAREMYNALGEQTFLTLVNFEGETINGFRNKYICIGHKLG